MVLVGNPNCGKTTLFNSLTGLRHHTGNWPGKTVSVDCCEGNLVIPGYTFDIVDLPGIYSLSSRTLEEDISAAYLLREHPDVVVNVIDAGNLEKNLFLTLQLIETGIPVVAVLNMNMFAARRGVYVDAEKLSCALGIPVIKLEAVNKTGCTELLAAVINYKKGNQVYFYDEMIESYLAECSINGLNRWSALLALTHPITDDSHYVNTPNCRFTQEYDGLSFIEIISQQKYQYISDMMVSCVEVCGVHRNITDVIDKVVMNRFLAIPIFLVVMFLLFQIVFSLGSYFMGWIDDLFLLVGEFFNGILVSFPQWVSSLIVDGILGGIGSVIVFLPNILLMFLMLSVLENSGYLARVAVVMDGIMKMIGLDGKSFIPLILGFGCSVPAIMACRTLENEHSKKRTMLLTPFMSCSARLPVYVLFTTAFFTKYQGLVLFSLYLAGILVALLVGFILRKTAFKDGNSAFIIELPLYRIPRACDVFFTMWDNGKEFLSRAGIVIFPAVLFVWLLASVPFGVAYSSSESVLGMIGSFIAPVFAPLGFGFAEASVAVLMGILAKEVVIGTLGTLFSCGDEGLLQVLPSVFSSLSALSFMVFVLLYVPCLSTMSVIKKESRSWMFTLFAGFMYFTVAWCISFLVYQGGILLGF